MASKKSHHIQNQKAPEPDKGSTQKETYNRHVFVEPGAKIDLVNDLKNDYKAANDSAEAHNRKSIFWARIAAIFTVLYFSVTALIYLSSKKSADAADRSAKTAESTIANTQESFRQDQRAWVGVGEIEITKFVEKDEFNMNVVFVNSGKTPAVNNQQLVRWAIFRKMITRENEMTYTDRPEPMVALPPKAHY